MKTKQLVFAAVFAALIAVGAQIRVPIGPVPFTLQAPMVLLCGMMLGKKYGLISVIVYIAVGLIGVPVFAGSGGLGSLISPSFGFVLGFIPAVVVTAMGGKENLSKMILFSILGMIVIFIFGVLYFSFIMHNVVGTPMGLSEILMVAVVPFLIKDFVLAVLTVLFARTLTKRGLVLQ
ncbi:Biotin transporter BioY [Jeotgalicoccus aerolatus]|jgi:biotin transport system substrate-specific component|uniref:Biotin transporter n=1 Tax=Jeotgalicoccus aerolatus TaxID=709510 RepID=A0A1G8ZTB2_9STAP|nr:biotin transporter BioY [Jeotgalicoccus aerolatus]MBP1951219.1 biotin transport system substrate-specific component [Jeotgalicoccus aerolatus]NMA81220.1 biotin transporter BioY [Jeotgalicoccus aerolatus]CAD2077590.1 Biotin transporter BioY [Jeotgalicoccus aerolatus]SDK17595.1 biotin transport system substrate-specific component [Jeotgalicoccus aerolatus]GGD99271.1 biotin transporter BioY [Jeotgalicoccus aerolatus]